MCTKCRWISNKQAYDSINCEKFCKIMYDAGISGKLIRIVRATMKGVEAQVKV
jgi:hypothetical protein